MRICVIFNIGPMPIFTFKVIIGRFRYWSKNITHPYFAVIVYDTVIINVIVIVNVVVIVPFTVIIINDIGNCCYR